MSLPNSYPIDIIETDNFLTEVSDLLTAEELSGLKTYLARNPESGVVIPGTNGIRKIRWGQKSKNRGKRGGVRAIYYYRDLNMPLFLLAVYAKGKKTDLSDRDKEELKALVDKVVNLHTEHTYSTVLQLIVSNI